MGEFFKKQSYKKEKTLQNICLLKKKTYLCSRLTDKTSKTHPKGAQCVGPFVYRLGRKIFILERGVRFPYGLLNQKKIENKDGKS